MAWVGFQTGPHPISCTPKATPGTVVTGTLTVTSNTSVTNQADTFASLPYTYTAG